MAARKTEKRAAFPQVGAIRRLPADHEQPSDSCYSAIRRIFRAISSWPDALLALCEIAVELRDGLDSSKIVLKGDVLIGCMSVFVR